MTESGTARLSGDGVYRYDLTRTWDDRPGPYPASRLMFLMLNPSTADALRDDHTIRRCRYFAKREGYGGLVVCNLYALRATDPLELLKVGSPYAMGPENKAAIERWLDSREVDVVVCAWGAHKLAGALARLNVEALVNERGLRCVCLGRTKSGAPRHPSRLGNDVELEPWGPYA